VLSALEGEMVARIECCGARITLGFRLEGSQKGPAAFVGSRCPGLTRVDRDGRAFSIQHQSQQRATTSNIPFSGMVKRAAHSKRRAALQS